MRTEVEMKCNDEQYKEWKAGERGYIDGYVRGGTGAPYCAVVIGERVVLAQTHQLKVIVKSQPEANMTREEDDIRGWPESETPLPNNPPTKWKHETGSNMKTTEDFLQYNLGGMSVRIPPVLLPHIDKAMQAYADQQVNRVLDDAKHEIETYCWQWQTRLPSDLKEDLVQILSVLKIKQP